MLKRDLFAVANLVWMAVAVNKLLLITVGDVWVTFITLSFIDPEYMTRATIQITECA